MFVDNNKNHVYITIVIPVYNVQNYIERCVKSFVCQNYEDYELILVDDGSTDDSGRVCDELAGKYSKVTAVHKENGGLASARNYGLKYAVGKYVTFVDSDDWVVENYLRTLDSCLKEHQPDVMKFGYQRVKDGVSGKITIPYYDVGLYNRDDIEKDILPGAIGPERLFDYNRTALLSACTCAYSLKFLKENHILFESEREILNEDHLFNIGVLLNAKSVYVSHEILYMYDYRGGSLSKRYVQKMLERKLKLLNRYKSLLVEKSLFDVYNKAYYAQCVDSFYACITNECGPWGKKNSVKNIKRILNEPECVYALVKCNHNNLGIKGNTIYWLMRTKQASMIYFIYRTLK